MYQPQKAVTCERALELYEKLKPFLRVQYGNTGLRWQPNDKLGCGYAPSFVHFVEVYGLELADLT